MKPPAQIPYTSRLSGFFRLPPEARLEVALQTAGASDESREHLRKGGSLPLGLADAFSENVVSTHGLPLSIATNFRVNGQDFLVPMAVEEPSIVAAASNAALLVRAGGGFQADADPPIMTTQVQLDDVPDPEQAVARVLAAREKLLSLGNQAIPRMVARGGGCVDLEGQVLDVTLGVVVFNLYVNVGQAMGANLVDQVAEAIAPEIALQTGGRMGLRILSNLPLRRKARASCCIPVEALGGLEVAEGIMRASRFASLDPLRAVTHNKGILNGIDAASVAFGQDWRAIEAAAHAFSSLSGVVRPLATWTLETSDGRTFLAGQITLPLSVGTVGGLTCSHPGVKAAFELAHISDAQVLASVLAAVGLASNLAALKALSGEGIQKGHMKLHHRKNAVALGDGRSV